jgi:hypothetical protein
MIFFGHNRNSESRDLSEPSEAPRQLGAVESPTILRRPIFHGDERNLTGSPPIPGAAHAHCRQTCSNSPYCAGRTAHHVSFFCKAPDAGQVSLAGDFNDWDATATPMTRMPDGSWTASLEVSHGHHQYVFLVDGKPTLDPKAMGRVRNEHNEFVSLIAVS